MNQIYVVLEIIIIFFKFLSEISFFTEPFYAITLFK